MSRRAPLVAAALLLALTGCLGEQPEDSPTGSTSPSSATTGSTTATSGTTAGTATPASPEPPTVPKVGECHRLTFAQAVAPTTRQQLVPCRSAHTTQTAYVGRLDLVVDGHLLAVDSERAQRQVASECPRRVAAYLGATRRDLRTSLARAVWFSPTLAESERGADWFRCDVTVLAQDGRLAEIGQMRGALADGSGEYGVCGTTAPGDRGFERVACARPHRWRAIGSYDLAGSDYPGETAMRTAGSDRCKSLAENLAESSLDFEWALDWPTREQWDQGQRWGLCWAPD